LVDQQSLKIYDTTLCYNQAMTKSKPTKKEAEKLQKQIDEYEAKPVRTNERPLKLNMTFNKAVDKILKAAKPPKKPKEK